MAAFRIFSRFAELLDINVARATASWLRLNTDGTVSERTGAQTLADIGAATAAQGAIVDAATSAATPDTLVLRGPNAEASFGDSGNGFSGNGVSASSNSGDGVSASSSSGNGVYAASSSGDGVYAASSSGDGVNASSDSGNGVYATSYSGIGMRAISVIGTNYAEFGNDGNDRSFIRRVLGLFGWHRGSYVQTLGSKSTLSADSAIELPDVASGTLMVGSNNLSDLDNTSTARTNLGAGTTGDALFTAATVAAARSVLQETYYRLASQQAFSSTTLTDVTGFTQSLDANSNYKIEGQVYYDSDTGGILICWECAGLESGAAGNGRGIFVGPSGLTGSVSYNVAIANGLLVYQESLARTGRPIYYSIMIRTGTSATTITLRARKNAATGGDTNIQTATWACIKKIPA